MNDNCKELKAEFLKCLKEQKFDVEEIKYFSMPYRLTSKNPVKKLALGEDIISLCKGDKYARCINKKYKINIDEERQIDVFGEMYEEKKKEMDKKEEERSKNEQDYLEGQTSKAWNNDK